MDYAITIYRGKKIFSGHFPKHEEKIQCMISMLKKYGWCFPPIPVTDMGAYFQAVDGSHRIAAAQQAKCCPEIVIIEAKLHPDQAIPKDWKEIVNAPLAYGRTIRGYGLCPEVQKHHIGVVLDKKREILTECYVKALFDILLYLGRQIPIIKKEIK